MLSTIFGKLKELDKRLVLSGRREGVSQEKYGFGTFMMYCLVSVHVQDQTSEVRLIIDQPWPTRGHS